MEPDVVDDIMTIDVAKIEENKTLKEAEDMMEKRQVRKLVVTRNGRPIAILEERKIWGKDPKKTIKESFGDEELKEAPTFPSGTIINDQVRAILAMNQPLVVMDRQKMNIQGIVTATDLKRLVEKRFQEASRFG